MSEGGLIGQSIATPSRVDIDTFSANLPGILELPKNAPRGIILFCDSSGSGLLSPRNAYLASVLHRSGFGTLLFDLLVNRRGAGTIYDGQFDINRLAERLLGATQWLQRRTEVRGLDLAYFAQGIGAAAALQASVRVSEVKTIVSWGGRPDLVWEYLHRVEAPTLFIVGGRDNKTSVRFNRLALERLNSVTARKAQPHELMVIPEATGRFEEAWVIERVGSLAAAWFSKCLP